MKKWLQSNKTTGLLIFGCTMTVFSALISYFYFSDRHLTSIKPKPPSISAPATLDTTLAPEELTSVTTALIGYGGAGHDGGHLTDVIQLVHIDFVNQQIAIISIPRDLWVQLPDGTAQKVNTAYALDSEHAVTLKSMIQQITGLNPEYFIGIDFVQFQRLIGETLQGITVNVPETLDDPWYPIKGEELNTCGMTPEEVASVSAQYSGFELEKQFPCRYEHVYFEQGPQQMEGGEALKYVRSRHGSAAGDFSRSQRQQALLKAIGSKLLSLDTLTDLPTFFETATQHTTTDIDLDAVKYLSPALQHIGGYQLKTIVLSTDNVLTTSTTGVGQFILIPKNNWQSVQQYVHTQLK